MSDNLDMSYEIVESLLGKHTNNQIRVSPENVDEHLKNIAEDLFVPYSDKSLLDTAEYLLKDSDKFFYNEHGTRFDKDKFENSFEQLAYKNAKKNHVYFTEDMAIKRVFRKYGDKLGDKGKSDFLELYKNTKEKSIKRGSSPRPSSLVAGCMYDICIKNNIPLSQKKLSEIMFTTEHTLRNSVARIRRINSEEKETASVNEMIATHNEAVKNSKQLSPIKSYQTSETPHIDTEKDTKGIDPTLNKDAARNYMSTTVVPMLSNPLYQLKKPGDFGKKSFFKKMFS